MKNQAIKNKLIQKASKQRTMALFFGDIFLPPSGIQVSSNMQIRY